MSSCRKLIDLMIGHLEIRTPSADVKLLQSVQYSAVSWQRKSMLTNAATMPLPDHTVERSMTGFVIPMRRLLYGIPNLPSMRSRGQLSRQLPLQMAAHFKIPRTLKTCSADTASSGPELGVRSEAIVSRS